MTQTPAEVFPPGEYLRDEIEERGWSVTEFAEISGLALKAVSEVLNAEREVTTETALAISEALGTSSEVWLNLQATYLLHQRRSTSLIL